MMRLWPRSLVWRTLLVLLLGVLVSNVAGVALYSNDRLDVLTSERTRQIAEQVAVAASALHETPNDERRVILRSMRQPGLRLFLASEPSTEGGADGWRGRLIRKAFLAELGQDEAGRLRLALGSRPFPPPAETNGRSDEAGWMRRHPPPWAAGATPDGQPDLRVLIGAYRLDDGSWLNFSAPIATFRPFWETPIFLVVVATTTMVLAVTVWAIRRATQPLAMFAEAAERLGRDVDVPPLAVTGPLEVERAAIAFNGMQSRLQRFVRDRTQMLAAMSHDLRTPLTRLRLRAELIEDEEQQRKTIADLEEMRAMIDAVLSFARDEAAVEPSMPLDLAAVLQTVCDEAADTGADATYAGPPRAVCTGRPAALKRAFANLVANAVTYAGAARVTLAVTTGELRVTVDDAGPGIPEAELTRVFEPFRRLESSRSRETGGVGLGLAIVRAAIAAHGGRVALANQPGGGLRATVDLPCATLAGRGGADGAGPTPVSLAIPPSG